MTRNNVNNYGSRLVQFFVSSEENEGFPLGDVNGDGKVSVKDCTMLKYYLAGRLTLTSLQLNRGDINGSGIISLKDVASIRNYVVFQKFITEYKFFK